MNRAIPFLLLPLSFAHAEIIDRIAITVGNRVVTESQIRLRIRLAAFQDNRQPDFSPAELRRHAERLVDQLLLLQEMDDARYPEPAMADILEEIREFRTERFPDERSFAGEMMKCGIEEEDLRQFFQLQSRTLQFLDVRFRTGVQVTSEEVAAHFEQFYKSRFVNAGRPVPPIEDVAEDIEEILTGQRVDAATEEWLKQSRTLTRIRLREEVFQ